MPKLSNKALAPKIAKQLTPGMQTALARLCEGFGIVEPRSLAALERRNLVEPGGYPTDLGRKVNAVLKGAVQYTADGEMTAPGWPK